MVLWKKKLGATMAALALISGAVPGMVGTANAIELGQHLDHGPKWPHKSIHFVQLGLIMAAAVATVFLVARSNKSDTPTSP